MLLISLLGQNEPHWPGVPKFMLVLSSLLGSMPLQGKPKLFKHTHSHNGTQQVMKKQGRSSSAAQGDGLKQAGDVERTV